MIKNYTRILCFCLAFITSSVTIGQNTYERLSQDETLLKEACATDLFHKEMMAKDVGYKNAAAQNELNSANDQITIAQQLSATEGVFQIPVVVHIMHLGESVGTGTNASDLEIRSAIEQLNSAWRALEGTIGDGAGVDMHIEFALAIRDENGNCTNGIERVDLSGIPEYVAGGVQSERDDPGIPSFLPDAPINSLKEISIWDPTQYYNIWVVNRIGTGGVAGFAFLAGAHGRPFDGTVIRISSFLSQTSSTLAHELGHAFNLFHTFQGDDTDDDGEPDTCSDDGVADTPMHFSRAISFGNCGSTDVNACDPNFDAVINPETGFRRNTGTHQDHLFNYMNSNNGCRNEFTGGQRVRVDNALSNQRSSFLNSLGLVPNGSVGVDFLRSTNIACVGSNVSFVDVSACIPNTFTNSGYEGISFLWTFDNGIDTPITSTLQNPSLAFTTEGIYDVTLAVTTLEGTQTLTKPRNLVVVPENEQTVCDVSSFNDDGNFGLGVTNVKLRSLNSLTSTFIPDGARLNFLCSRNTILNFDVTYNLEISYRSRRDPQFLEAWIDWDGNGLFETFNSNGINERVLEDRIDPNLRITALAEITVPESAVQDQLITMRVISNVLRRPNVCGEEIVQRADDYGIYVSEDETLRRSAVDAIEGLALYPNPGTTQLTLISNATTTITSYAIFDINGKQITEAKPMLQSGRIDISNLSKGFYFLELMSETNIRSIKKFVKI